MLFFPFKRSNKNKKGIELSSLITRYKIEKFQEVYSNYGLGGLNYMVFIIDLYKKGNYLRSGYGFFTEKDNKFITNLHLFKDADRANIRLSDTLKLKVKSILAYEGERDIIVVKVDMQGFKPYTPKVINASDKVGNELFFIHSFRKHEPGFPYYGVISFIKNIDGFRILFSDFTKKTAYAGLPVFGDRNNIIGMLVNYKGDRVKSFIVPIKDILNIRMIKPIRVSDFKVPSSICESIENISSFEQGQALINAKSYNKASMFFRKSLKKEPNNIKYMIALGKALSLAKSKKAIKILEKVLLKQPENKEVLFYLGHIYRIYGSYSDYNYYNKAIKVFNRIIESNQSSFDDNRFYYKTYWELIKVYTDQLTYKKAIKLYNDLEERGYVTSNPDNYYLIAYCYYNLSQYRKMTDVCNNILLLSPNYYKVYFLLGMVYLKNGFNELALEKFKKAGNLKPNNCITQYILGLLYVKFKDKEKVTSIMEKLKELSDNGKTREIRSDADRYRKILKQSFLEDNEKKVDENIKYFLAWDEVKKAINYREM